MSAKRAPKHAGAPGARKRSRRATGDPGRAGSDPVASGLSRVSSVIPIGAKGVAGTIGLYNTSWAEFIAALIALVHWMVAEVGRGDVSDAAARNRRITGPWGHRVAIRYIFEGVAHWYLPDYVGRTHDGRPIVIEGGIGARKGSPQELAKLEAARAWAESQGGELWVIAAELVPGRWVRGALSLYLSSLDYRGDRGLVDAIRRIWDREAVSIGALCTRLAPEHARDAVVAAARKAAGDLLGEGLLGLDLAVQVLTYDTPIRARAPEDRVEPPGIIRDLGVLRAMAEAAPGEDGADDVAPADRPDIDPDSIEDPAVREEFLSRQAAITDVLGGMPATQAAAQHGIYPRRLQQLVVQHRKHGDRALLPYGRVASPASGLEPEMEALIGELFRATTRPTVAAIVEDRRVHALSARLGRKRTPTRYEVTKVVNALLAADQSTREARAGRKLVPLAVTGSAVVAEFVPGNRVEFDEGTLDVKVLALAGTATTVRLHIGVLIDVATRYPLSVVVSPKALDQWDFRRAVMRALLPDDDFRARFGIRRTSPWH